MLHETDADRVVQEAILADAARAWKCGYQTTSAAYPFDAIFTRDGVGNAAVEVRRRDCNRNDYPTFMWSLQKFVHLKQFAQLFPVIVIIAWNDGIGYANLDDLNPEEIKFCDRSGTTQRTDADNEPVVHLPVTAFKRLG